MAAKKKAAEETGETKSLILYLNNGKEKKIVVPKEAKLTFGPGIPGPRTINQGSFTSNDREYCLRVYVGDKESGLIAVFAGIREFRDLSIACDEMVIREAGNTVWRNDETGYKHETNVNYERVMVGQSQLTKGIEE